MNRRGFLAAIIATPVGAVAPKSLVIPAVVKATPRTTIRTGLPSPQWRKMHEGIQPHGSVLRNLTRKAL